MPYYMVRIWSAKRAEQFQWDWIACENCVDKISNKMDMHTMQCMEQKERQHCHEKKMKKHTEYKMKRMKNTIE